ncbi:MAG: hypothetical protein ABIO71_10495 [Caldimonas sp.]
MNVFRWIIGVVAALMAVGALVSLGVNIASESRVWLERARRFRRWLWLVALLWFNVEVWGRVLFTLIRWKS